MFITVDQKSEKVVATVSRQSGKRDKPGCQLFNDFESFQRLPNTPFNISGRPRAMSVDSNINRVVTPNELKLAITSITHDDQPRQSRARRASFNPTLPTIAEEEDDDVLQFISTLFH